MRVRRCWMPLIALLVACAPKPGPAREAREAEYAADARLVFAVVQKVAEAQYGIADRNDDALAVATRERWYTAEGGAAEPTDGAVGLAFIVRVEGAAGAWLVNVQAVGSRRQSSGSETQPILEGEMPPWVSDKIDALYVAIHARLKQHAI
jgi:hypothetical protein